MEPPTHQPAILDMIGEMIMSGMLISLVLRYCGGYFGSAPASVTVKTEKIPFHMTVSFDGSEQVQNNNYFIIFNNFLPQDPGPATYEYSKGFYLYYKQGECT